jgi:hypothetical protein
MSEENSVGPLSGRRIALPETRELDRLAGLLEEQGTETVRCPMLAIRDMSDALAEPLESDLFRVVPRLSAGRCRFGRDRIVGELLVDPVMCSHALRISDEFRSLDLGVLSCREARVFRKAHGAHAKSVDGRGS